MDQKNTTRDEGSFCIRISDVKKLSEASGSSNTIFEPQSSIETGGSCNNNEDFVLTRTTTMVRAPEKKLTLFALRLAIFEKAATGLGTLGFIWATVVLLGGFAITLDKTDFWVITVILLIEGTRIFSRSHELEWQSNATWSITDAGIYSFNCIKSSSRFIVKSTKEILLRVSLVKKDGENRTDSMKGRNSTQGSWVRRKTPTRTWISSDVPLLPYVRWVFISRNVSKLLYWLQILSATACVVLSTMKLIMHNYGEVEKGDSDKRNRKSALIIFYSLALAEALLFLMEKIYWEWNIIYCKILEEVNKQCELGPSSMITIKRFFYDAYSRCVNGSIFDGLKMDLVTFAIELLGSNSADEKLCGARILRQFANSVRYSDDTLQKIGINFSVIERLVEMLNWKDTQEEEIRQSAAEILVKLAGKKQNSLRVAEISGAMESISSLLETNRISRGSADEIGEKKSVHDHANYGFWTFNHLGLLLLKKLARDLDNCEKIGNTRGLLPKIIDFTHAESELLTDENSTRLQTLTVKRSLQLVKMLVGTTGPTGKHLRREISEIVFTISNIRDILRHGGKQPMLQKLGIEILTSLGLEKEATDMIGETGGVLKELFGIFFKEGMPENENHVRIAAGEALAMLALESRRNCRRVLKLCVLDRLVEALDVPLLRVNAARILRNMCDCAESDCFHQLKEVKAAAPTVLKAIISEENKLQEVMVGLASHVFKFMTSQEANILFHKSQITQTKLAQSLIHILRKYQNPGIKIPRMRRFVIELAIWMMQDNKTNIQIFKDLGMSKELDNVLETTAELENFNIFSGTVGLSRYSTTIHSLVEAALKLLEER